MNINVLSRLVHIFLLNESSFSNIFTAKIAFVKCKRNRSRTPVKKPRYELPLCWYICWAAPKYVEDGLTFSRCVLMQSKGMTNVVLIIATIADAGIKYLTGMVSFSPI